MQNQNINIKQTNNYLKQTTLQNQVKPLWDLCAQKKKYNGEESFKDPGSGHRVQARDSQDRDIRGTGLLSEDTSPKIPIRERDHLRC